MSLQTLNCEWCSNRVAEFELTIYHIKKITTQKRAHDTHSAYENWGRGDRYVTIKICEKCLPVTKIEEHTEYETITKKIRVEQKHGGQKA